MHDALLLLPAYRILLSVPPGSSQQEVERERERRSRDYDMIRMILYCTVLYCTVLIKSINEFIHFSIADTNLLYKISGME